MKRIVVGEHRRDILHSLARIRESTVQREQM
jgi:hypothetical protein